VTLATVTVTGTVIDAGQNPAPGTVTFTPTATGEGPGGVPVITSVADAADQVVIPMTGVTETLDASGQFTTTLIPTDAAGLVPGGWLYQVSVQIPGVADYGFTCTIPTTPNPVDLSALVPVQPPVPPLPGGGGTATWDLTVPAGSLQEWAIALDSAGPAGGPWDITGATWEYTVRTTAAGTGMPLLSVTTTDNADGVIAVTSTDAESQVLLTLYPAATAGVTPATFYHALWRNPGTDSALAVLTGQLVISAIPQP
jgi:hypothetical protein